VTKVISSNFYPTYHQLMTLSSEDNNLQAEAPFPPLHLKKLAHEFAAEIASSTERKKKNLPSPPGIQLFLLYVRAQGNVPAHKVAGAITVQTIVGNARLTAETASYDLPEGSMVCVAGGVPHELFAETETVLLVTHTLQG
jgi:quercetin dioxygenase-like cupin family protein